MKMKEITDFLMHRLLLRNMVNPKGASAVEFAIVLPLLLAFLFGIIEFSLIAYNKQVITNAAREGARAGIVARNTPMPSAKIREIVRNYAQNYLITFGDDGLTDADIIVVPDPTTSAVFEDELRVTVEFDYQFLVFSGIMNLLFPDSSQDGKISLDGISVMIYE